MLCRICIVHSQTRKPVLHRADCSRLHGPTRQHELQQADEEFICALQDLDHEVEIDDKDHLCKVCKIAIVVFRSRYFDQVDQVSEDYYCGTAYNTCAAVAVTTIDRCVYYYYYYVLLLSTSKYELSYRAS